MTFAQYVFWWLIGANFIGLLLHTISFALVGVGVALEQRHRDPDTVYSFSASIGMLSAFLYLLGLNPFVWRTAIRGGWR